MSTLNVNAIQKINGDKHSRINFASGPGTAIASGLTYSSAIDNTTTLIGSVSGGTDTSVRALYLTISYTHNGSTNHGYMTGWWFQTGKTFNVDGVAVRNSHYDWYYNVIDTVILLPWDPSGTQSVSFYSSYTYNTSSSNTYNIYNSGFVTQET